MCAILCIAITINSAGTTLDAAQEMSKQPTEIPVSGAGAVPSQAATPVEAAKELVTLQEALQRYIARKAWRLHTVKHGATRYKFRGICIGEDSTRWENGRENSRWTEELLYATDNGKFVVATASLTRWQGESDTYTTEVVAALNDVASQALLDDLRETLCKELNVAISVAEVARPLSELEA